MTGQVPAVQLSGVSGQGRPAGAGPVAGPGAGAWPRAGADDLPVAQFHGLAARERAVRGH